MGFLRKGWITACLLAGLAPQTWAADYETPLQLPAGAKIEFTVARGRSGPGTAILAGKTITLHYRQNITPEKTGYRVHQILTGTEVPAGIDPSSRAAFERTMSAVRDYIYETDDALTPVKILNWQSYIDSVVQATATLLGPGKDIKALYAMGKTIQTMTPEQGAASFLEEQNMVAIPQNTALNLKKPSTATSEVRNPLGGPVKTRQYWSSKTSTKTASWQ